MTQETRAIGRPRKYSSPEEFDAKVVEYHNYCREKEEPVTWTGLALYLGFSSRQSIDEYQNYDGFSDSVRKAKALVEWHYEMRLHGNNPTGAIFALKNYGWNDRQEVDHSSKDGSMSPKPALDVSQLSAGTLAELMAAKSKA